MTRREVIGAGAGLAAAATGFGAKSETGFADATAMAEAVRRGEITARSLVEAAVARTQSLNPKINAVILPTFEAALKEADTFDRSGDKSRPFAGVPFLFKDIGATIKGQPMAEGSALLKALNRRAGGTTPLGARFQAAGLISLGKTNIPELGLHSTTEGAAFGPTHNPFAEDRSAGGSSGGSAAAVAAGMVPMAHASDTGGSTRVPAAWCGLLGLKPSRGRITHGRGSTNARWVEFAVTGSVRDTARLLDAVAGALPGDLYIAPPPARPYAAELAGPSRRRRIGVIDPQTEGLDAEVAASLAAAARLSRDLKHETLTVDAARIFGGLPEQALTILRTLSGRQRLRYLASVAGRKLNETDVEPMTWAVADLSRTISAEELEGAQGAVQGWTSSIAPLWGETFDLLVTPTTPMLPVKLGTATAPPLSGAEALDWRHRITRFTFPFNVSGQPALTLPLYLSTSGLPMGLQAIGAYGREDLLITFAAELERIGGWNRRLG